MHGRLLVSISIWSGHHYLAFEREKKSVQKYSRYKLVQGPRGGSEAFQKIPNKPANYTRLGRFGACYESILVAYRTRIRSDKKVRDDRAVANCPIITPLISFEWYYDVRGNRTSRHRNSPLVDVDEPLAAHRGQPFAGWLSVSRSIVYHPESPTAFRHHPRAGALFDHPYARPTYSE